MRIIATAAAAILLTAPTAGPQAPRPLSRADALDAALARGARLGLARSDTTLAAADVTSAHALPNPSLSASYSKSVPQLHLTAEFPIDYASVRSTRIQAADAGRVAAGFRFAFDRASVALDADTSYTRAVAALEHATLSRRNALDADSLRKLAVARRADGDASDLEVELATLNAGQQANIAADDSSAAVSSLLDLQSLIGEATDRVAIQPSDSLAMPPDALTPARVDSTLPVGAAAMSLHAADLGAALERRSIWGMPSVLVGLETRDPTGAERGILPTLGFSLPFPLLDKNRGAIAVADAERDRAQAELALARVETEADIARAARLRQLALAKIARDTTLIADANRLSSMALDAYREGASTIPTVLEAQRNAREQRGQLIDDLAAAWIATAELRVFQLTPSSLPPK